MLKFRGAGQGVKALVAEVVAGELARALGLPVPEIVLIELDPALGAAERSGDPGPDHGQRRGQRGLDFLPGSLPSTPAAGLAGAGARC